MPETPEKESQKNKLPSLVLSILAAAIGVQSNKNREKDFANSSIWPYVIGGVVFTVCFIAVLLIAVKTMIANA